MRLTTWASAFVLVMGSTNVYAQLPDQPILLTEAGDYGGYATQDEDSGLNDPLLHKAYDNISLSGKALVDGISWAGTFSEPIPATPSSINFVIEIWDSLDELPDVSSAPVAQWKVEGGIVGTSSDFVNKEKLEHVSRATPTTVGGGEAFAYVADLEPKSIDAGSYWISIIAEQRFDSIAPVFDPEWQWHFGQGPGDGHTAFSRETNRIDTSLAGVPIPDLDFAFTLTGEITDPCDNPSLKAGDFNENGTVEFGDFLLLSSNFGKSGPGILGDADCNETVDFGDFLVLSSNFGQPVAAAAVPEPQARLMILVGLLSLLVGKRRFATKATLPV